MSNTNGTGGILRGGSAGVHWRDQQGGASIDNAPGGFQQQAANQSSNRSEVYEANTSRPRGVRPGGFEYGFVPLRSNNRPEHNSQTATFPLGKAQQIKNSNTNAEIDRYYLK